MSSSAVNLYDVIQKIIQSELKQLRVSELAVVEEQHSHASDSDKDNYSCTVALRNSGIVLKKVPVTTARIGSVSLPNIGDLVLVQFVNGNINAPVITGCLYNEEHRPPVNGDGKTVMHFPLGEDDDNAVHVEFSGQDNRALALKLGKGLEINIKDDDPVIDIQVDGGKAAITIARDGEINIQSDGNVTLKGNEVTIEAQGTMNLKGRTINLN